MLMHSTGLYVRKSFIKIYHTKYFDTKDLQLMYYCSLMKEGPWAVHLISGLERG